MTNNVSLHWLLLRDFTVCLGLLLRVLVVLGLNATLKFILLRLGLYQVLDFRNKLWYTADMLSVICLLLQRLKPFSSWSCFIVEKASRIAEDYDYDFILFILGSFTNFSASANSCIVFAAAETSGLLWFDYEKDSPRAGVFPCWLLRTWLPVISPGMFCSAVWCAVICRIILLILLEQLLLWR